MSKPKPITSIDDLVPDESNANRGTERGRAIIRNSMEKRGTGRGVFVDRDGVIIAGKNAIQEARALGKKIVVVDSEGDTLVVHRRTDLKAEDEAAQLMGIEDNRAGELGLDWDEEMLAEKADAIDLEDAGWDEAEQIDFFAEGDETSARQSPTPKEDDGTAKAPKSPLLKIVVRVDELPTFELAMRRTGVSNRGQALLALARHYLGEEEERFEDELL